MAKRLVEHLTTNYLAAAQQLNPRHWRKKIVAYVESYDDVLFWKDLLSKVENDYYFFEVMLPSRTSLQKGKKCALMNTLGAGLGQYMIACVDADYDYLMQGTTEVSQMICENPYVFHTYAYAIENFQCYAPALHNVCVMATLNDHYIFDFESFMTAYSQLVFPLFVWSVWCYRNKKHQHFTMADLCQTIAIHNINIHNPENALARIARRVNIRTAELQRRFPEAKGSYQNLRDEMKQLGVTPETTYLYIRGHDICDKVITPIIDEVCDILRREREREIRKYANHQTQCLNELAGYQHASAPPEEMLRKHTGYNDSPLYRNIRNDIQKFLDHIGENRPNKPVITPERYEQTFLRRSNPFYKYKTHTKKR